MSGIESWNLDDITPCTDNELCLAIQLPSERLTIRRTLARADSYAPEHSHPYDQVVTVYGGEMAITCDGREHPLAKGMVLHIAAGTVHSAIFRAGCEYMELGLGVDRSLIAGVERAS